MNEQISKRLKKETENILLLWQERALREVASADTADSLALRDSIPKYLEHLCHALAANRQMDVKSVMLRDHEAIRIGRLHGEDRAGTPRYVLTEVIFEYHILREIIFDVLEKDHPLSQDHRNIIYSSIEQAVNDAAVKFSEVHADIQQNFVNTLTHDLKTPLTVAMMSAQLILKRPDKTNDCMQAASRIIAYLNRLDSMIHDLLDISRIRAGESLSLQFCNCDLSVIARDVMDEFILMHENITLATKGDIKGYFSCEGIRRALENLIGNAIKYGKQGSLITVSVARADQTVIFTVHNEGNVIPQSEMPLLFEQYRRSKTAHESQNTGWGLGLALVKGVADAHKGKTEVMSTESEGTTFTMTIPFKPYQ